MNVALTLGANLLAGLLYFGAGWLIRHYTMPAADPAAPAVPALPAGPNLGGILGPVLQSIEQQLLADLAGHIGGIVRLPIPAPPAPK